ncbi:dolichyl-P-Man:Man(7)GlcNAc(2)-PP-dolichol alpha-1,6-mannosyltransferase [Martiniozyma asiatica (nom. inval.)]|nr:dolichyl-P-Man:Man(7)GlcNAc(2)-PP-dolichol alpha-1,6-mannosyltransferase [Martiniozyma asiatica]
MALPFILTSFAMFISGNIPQATILLAFVGTTMRFEVLIFTVIIGSVAYLRGLANLRLLLLNFIIGSASGALLSFKLDSLFYLKSTLPELNGFIFNVLLNKSADWGVEPWYYYFTNYLPKLYIGNGLMVPLFAILFLLSCPIKWLFKFKRNDENLSFVDNVVNACYELDRVNYHLETVRSLFVASLLYLLLMSFNGHKEWRFIVYAIYPINMGAACVIDYLLSWALHEEVHQDKEDTESLLPQFIKFTLPSMLLLGYLCGIISSLAFAFVSSWNYPGAFAVQKLNGRIMESQCKFGNFNPLSVHLDVGTCVSGASLFLQPADNREAPSSWLEASSSSFWIKYDKCEDDSQLQDMVNANKLNYWIQFKKDPVIEPTGGACHWELVDIVEAYNGIQPNLIRQMLGKPRHSLNIIAWNSMHGNFNWLTELVDATISKAQVASIYEYSCEPLL